MTPQLGLRERAARAVRRRGRRGRGELIAVTRMIAASPSLLAREQQIFARYTDTLAQLIAEETGATAGDLRPSVVANALIAYVREQLEAGANDRGRREQRNPLLAGPQVAPLSKRSTCAW